MGRSEADRPPQRCCPEYRADGLKLTQALLWEMRPQLNDSVDTARLARFIIATLEGAVLMSRVTKEIGVMEHIAADLKRFIGMHLREGAPVS